MSTGEMHIFFGKAISGASDKKVHLMVQALVGIVSVFQIKSNSESETKNVGMEMETSVETKCAIKEKLAEQFVMEYRNPVVKERCIKYLRACLHDFKNSPQTRFSPYIAVVQSSGYGKSRLLRETAKEVISLYVCDRPEISTGYPHRTVTALLALFYDLNTDSKKEYIADLKVRLRLCVESAICMESKLLEKEENSAIKGAVKSALFPSECHL